MRRAPLDREPGRAAAVTALFAIRVAAGLAAWLLFNAFTQPGEAFAWRVHGSFVAYFLLNLLLVLRYRARSPGWALRVADAVVNVVTVLAPLAASGGVASPLVFLLVLNTTASALLFGVATGFACAGTSAAGLTLLWVAEATGLVPALSPRALPLGALAPSFLVSGYVLLAGVAALAFLVARIPAPAVRAPQPSRRRSEGEAMSGTVANALLAVSEAVSRLTRLPEILETVVEIAPRSLAVESCGIALWAEDPGVYVGAVAAGAMPPGDRRFSDLRVRPDEAPDFEWARHLGHCVVVPASESQAEASPAAADVLIAPLQSGERFYGVIQFARRSTGRSFTQRDLTLADGIARQTAVALERARLVEESRRLVRALESTGEAVVITDARERVIFVNPAFLRTFGFAESEVVGNDLSRVGGADAGWVRALGPRGRPAGWRGETSAYHRDGRPIPVMVDASVIRAVDGGNQGGVAILEDISAEKLLQEQMQRADRLAAVGEMAAGIAHEINNALAAIFGQTARRRPWTGSSPAEALERIDGQARRIFAIVQGVLNFARPTPPLRVPIDLRQAAAETLELVRHDIQRFGVELETDYPQELPDALADPQQIQQILLNLFGNSLREMSDRPAPRCLRVSVVEMDERVAVRVEDTGPGIPPDILPHIFDPFFSTRPSGSGLGLSVSYAIARAHDGDLVAEAGRRSGATFTLLLPVVAPLSGGGPWRVLLVDDDPEVAEAISDMLRDEGLAVEQVATGAEALGALAEGDWDAVFLDVRLPDQSGSDVYAELVRMRPELARRVVFVTGGLWRAQSSMRQTLAGHRVLAKPCTPAQVRAVLRDLRQVPPEEDALEEGY